MTHKLKANLIAPCGMNCGVCLAHLRARNPCPGCNVTGWNRPVSRERCVMRVCDKRAGRFCCGCPEFPCAKLKQLDRRYRTKYVMSQIENLEFIHAHGIRAFMASEQIRWISTKGILCVHDGKHYSAGMSGRAPASIRRSKGRG